MTFDPQAHLQGLHDRRIAELDRTAPKQGHTGTEGDGSWRPNSYRDLRDRIAGGAVE